MKIRSGFVSNSSSSSFIIIAEKPTKCPECKQDIAGIRKSIKDFGSGSEIRYEGRDVLNKLLKERGFIESDTFDDVILLITDALLKEKEVLEVEISNWDEESKMILYSDAVRIILTDEDYDW